MNELRANSPDERWQFSLTVAFRWLLLVAVYSGILAAVPVAYRAYYHNVPPATANLVTFGGCWLVLLAYYIRRRHVAAAAVHVAVPAFVAPLALGKLPGLPGLAFSLGVLIFCSTASFVISLWKDYSAVSQKHLAPGVNLLINVPAGGFIGAGLFAVIGRALKKARQL
jgi:hypothetical protein